MFASWIIASLHRLAAVPGFTVPAVQAAKVQALGHEPATLTVLRSAEPLLIYLQRFHTDPISLSKPSQYELLAGS